MWLDGEWEDEVGVMEFKAGSNLKGYESVMTFVALTCLKYLQQSVSEGTVGGCVALKTHELPGRTEVAHGAGGWGELLDEYPSVLAVDSSGVSYLYMAAPRLSSRIEVQLPRALNGLKMQLSPYFTLFSTSRYWDHFPKQTVCIQAHFSGSA